ncbi:YncE family protein [Actinopolymorpha alba]|uniref:YncE family protein n=1 Tax=Actinopolymorpha alba TaxID=533267 RepID=UPI00039FEC38|nr:YncE family protein [Actinopolymorpha alba]
MGERLGRAVDFRESRTVDVSAGPHLHIGYVKEAGEVWVCNTGGNTITVLDHADGRILHELPIGAGPAHFSFDKGCHLGCVTLSADDAVVIISPLTHAIHARISLPAGSRPTGTMPAFDRSRMYTLNLGNATVSAIDTDQHTLVASMAVGGRPMWGQPWGASYKPITKPVGKSYVVGADSDDLTVFDDKTDTVLGRIPVGRQPIRNAIFREHGTIYTANAGDSTVTVVRIRDDEVLALIPVEAAPFRLLPVQAIAGRDEMWVLSAGSAGSPGGVSVLSGTEHVVLRTVEVVDHPANWVVNTHKNLFVVSGDGRQLSVIDLPADRIVGTSTLSHDPAQGAISGLIYTEPGTLFVLNADNTVSLFTDRNA